MDRHDADYLAHRVQEAICNAMERAPLGVDEDWLDLHSEKIVEALIGKRLAEPLPLGTSLVSIAKSLDGIAGSLETMLKLLPDMMAMAMRGATFVATDELAEPDPPLDIVVDDVSGEVVARQWDDVLGCWIEGIN